jgi:hypothetical protein
MSRIKRQSISVNATAALAREPGKKMARAAVCTFPAQKIAKAKGVRQPLAQHRLLPDWISAACRNCAAGARRWLRWLQARRRAQLAAKRLRLCETLSLGDKRFVAIVQVDGQQFLLGGAAERVSLLAQLDSELRFAKVLQESNVPQRTQE